MTNFFRISTFRKQAVFAGGTSAAHAFRTSSAGTLTSAQLKQIIADLIG